MKEVKSMEELRHYGIKGMKWGIRRFQKKDGSLTPAGKKRYSGEIHSDYSRAHSKKSVKSMSDNELRERLNRLDMERRYSKFDTSTVEKRGKVSVDKVLKTMGEAAAATDLVLRLASNTDRIKKLIPVDPRKNL